jgi:hypothetical protein
MGGVRSKIAACGSKSSAKGEVKIKVKVAPDGSVSSATHDSGDAAQGNCMASAAQKARFKKTQKGGGFKYPWKF